MPEGHLTLRAIGPKGQLRSTQAGRRPACLVPQNGRGLRPLDHFVVIATGRRPVALEKIQRKPARPTSRGWFFYEKP